MASGAASDLRTVAPWHAKNSSTDGGATTRQRVAPWNEEQGVRGRCGLVLSQLRFARTITTGVCVSDGRLGASGVTMSAIIAGVARPATKMIHSSRCWKLGQPHSVRESAHVRRRSGAAA